MVMLRRAFLKATAFLSTLPFIGQYVKASPAQDAPAVQEFWLIDQVRGAGKTEWCCKKALQCLKKYKTTVVIGAVPRDFMVDYDFRSEDGGRLKYSRDGDTITLGGKKYGDHRLIIMPMNFSDDRIRGLIVDAVIVDNLEMIDCKWLETFFATCMWGDAERTMILCGTCHSVWFKQLEREWLARKDDPEWVYIPRTTPISEVEV